ncbi:hypothetical protein DIE07_14380 [Burkholderia sp. Bp9002]|nr:hypothetical protein DIE07_14380 [Burkholderia sp. Bp9002]
MTLQRDFERIYLAEPERRPLALDDLADEYLRRCEAYDRIVCTGPIREGAIMPATSRERALTSRHAHKLRAELLARAACMGYSAVQFGEAIRAAERRLDAR